MVAILVLLPHGKFLAVESEIIGPAFSFLLQSKTVEWGKDGNLCEKRLTTLSHTGTSLLALKPNNKRPHHRRISSHESTLLAGNISHGRVHHGQVCSVPGVLDGNAANVFVGEAV